MTSHYMDWTMVCSTLCTFQQSFASPSVWYAPLSLSSFHSEGIWIKPSSRGVNVIVSLCILRFVTGIQFSTWIWSFARANHQEARIPNRVVPLVWFYDIHLCNSSEPTCCCDRSEYICFDVFSKETEIWAIWLDLHHNNVWGSGCSSHYCMVPWKT